MLCQTASPRGRMRMGSMSRGPPSRMPPGCLHVPGCSGVFSARDGDGTPGPPGFPWFLIGKHCQMMQAGDRQTADRPVLDGAAGEMGIGSNSILQIRVFEAPLPVPPRSTVHGSPMRLVWRAACFQGPRGATRVLLSVLTLACLQCVGVGRVPASQCRRPTCAGLIPELGWRCEEQEWRPQRGPNPPAHCGTPLALCKLNQSQQSQECQGLSSLIATDELSWGRCNASIGKERETAQVR